jgi:hypothetical protein
MCHLTQYWPSVAAQTGASLPFVPASTQTQPGSPQHICIHDVTGVCLQIFFSLLGVLMARHSKALLPTWEEAVDSAGQTGSNALQQQLAAVAASGTATDARFKAYVGLLLGLINVSVQVRQCLHPSCGL